MTNKEQLDPQEKLLAAIAYAESSAKDDADEMSALASVMVRQRDARGYSTIQAFVKNEKTFSFVVADGNPRYSKLMKATPAQIKADTGMGHALAAARNALAQGPDKSNGAYFWDGIDIKTNYKNHYKVRHGIRFSSPDHNIYGISESTKVVRKLKTVITKDKKGKIIDKQEIELDRADHIYVSTAAHGGTIFWKHNAKCMSVTGAKAYK